MLRNSCLLFIYSLQCEPFLKNIDHFICLTDSSKYFVVCKLVDGYCNYLDINDTPMVNWYFAVFYESKADLFAVIVNWITFSFDCFVVIHMLICVVICRYIMRWKRIRHIALHLAIHKTHSSHYYFFFEADVEMNLYFHSANFRYFVVNY